MDAITGLGQVSRIVYLVQPDGPFVNRVVPFAVFLCEIRMQRDGPPGPEEDGNENEGEIGPPINSFKK